MSSSDSSFSVQNGQYVHMLQLQEEKHTLLLLLLLLLSGGLGTASSRSAAGGSGCGTSARANVQEQVLDVLALKSLSKYIRNPVVKAIGIFNAHLGEKGSPYRLNTVNLCGTDQSLELVGLE